MSAEQLDTFVRKVMDINGGIPTMGAAAGIFGITGMGANSVSQLKKVAIEFATEYRKGAGNAAALRLGQEIEGLLSTLQVMSVITDQRCEQLIADLHELVDQPG